VGELAFTQRFVVAFRDQYMAADVHYALIMLIEDLGFEVHDAPVALRRLA
jgi:hypothetical protein